MAELVRFQLLPHGRVEFHLLDYNDERRYWVSWQGVGWVKRESPQHRASLGNQSYISTTYKLCASIPVKRPDTNTLFNMEYWPRYQSSRV
jgi:hypothetical protein